MQDGGFTLDANGVRVLTLEGIFYRGAKEDKSDADPSPPEPKAAPSLAPTQEVAFLDARWKSHTVPYVAPSRSAALPGGLAGRLLGGVLGSTPSTIGSSNENLLGNLGGILRRYHEDYSSSMRRNVAQDGTTLLVAPPGYAVLSSNDVFQNGRPRVLIGRGTHGDTSALDYDTGIMPPLLDDTSMAVNPYSGSSAPSALASSYPAPKNYANSKRDSSDPQPAFGFSGIFFSTFFGGHDQSWASPVDQYAWFKDFKVAVNA